MKSFSRRTFLKNASKAACLPAFAELSLPAHYFSEMTTRIIPSSSERLPVVGLGTWQQFDIGTDSNERTALIEVLKNVAKRGGKVIDSSPMYGRSEQMVGELAQQSNLAGSFFYASKVWTRGKEQGIHQIGETMRKMKRETMDLMQVHNLLDFDTHINTLMQLKAENKVRYIGATHYASSAHADLERLIEKQKIDFLQFNYNISERNAEKSLLPRALEKGVAVIVNEPFASGTLFQRVKGKTLPEWSSEWDINSWAQFFLKYILSHPAVTCVIPGTSNPKHALDNMGAGHGKFPDDAGRRKMATYFASI